MATNNSKDIPRFTPIFGQTTIQRPAPVRTIQRGSISGRQSDIKWADRKAAKKSSTKKDWWE